jgi:hypothetical protein
MASDGSTVKGALHLPREADVDDMRDRRTSDLATPVTSSASQGTHAAYKIMQEPQANTILRKQEAIYL